MLAHLTLAGDVVVIGSDGLFDNLWESDMLGLVHTHLQASLGLAWPWGPGMLQGGRGARARVWSGGAGLWGIKMLGLMCKHQLSRHDAKQPSTALLPCYAAPAPARLRCAALPFSSHSAPCQLTCLLHRLPACLQNVRATDPEALEGAAHKLAAELAQRAHTHSQARLPAWPCTHPAAPS